MSLWFSPALPLSALILLFLVAPLSGCLQGGEAEAKNQSSRPNNKNGPINVDTAIAVRGQLQTEPEYTGTTSPWREVSLKAQAEGQLQSLRVDVGDRVEQGEILAQLDDDLLQGSLNQAQAEKAAQNSALATAQSQVGDAQIKVEQARLQLQQAQADILRLQATTQTRIEQARLEAQQTQADAERYGKLAQEGATAAQIAEQSRTKARQAQQILRQEQVNAQQQLSQTRTAAQTAAKILRSAQAQVKITQQQVKAAQAQVKAQKALLEQSQTRRAYATLRSPLTGKVLQRSSEPGNLVQAGTEILKLGDFSRIKIRFNLTDKNLGQVRLGQKVRVRLDAYPEQEWSGRISRISPVANPQSRLVPLELTIDNPQGKIGAGLLARVQLLADAEPEVVIPSSAVQGENKVFIVARQGPSPKVEARTVKIGNSSNGQVEILRGLAPGDRYVVRSSEPLQEGKVVNISALSSTPQP